MVNITLSADEQLVAKARAYAQKHNLTLNQLIRNYLQRISGHLDGAQAAQEFAELARRQPGQSEDGFVFDRKAAHRREKWS